MSHDGLHAPPNSPTVGFLDACDLKDTYLASVTPSCPRMRECTVFENNNWDAYGSEDDYEFKPSRKLRRQVRSTNLAATAKEALDEAAEHGYSSDDVYRNEPSSLTFHTLPHLHAFEDNDTENEGNGSGTSTGDSDIIGSPPKPMKFFL